MWIILSFVFLCLPSVTGHISLIYPPARKYDFDFLDNTRTPGPCGVPKGLGPTTTLLAGSTINVNFHLAYPHLGGFFLEVMNNNTNAIIRHPQTGYFSTQNTTVRSAEFTLPNQECRGCWIRLIRQAREWGANCRSGYLFWSCADVDIIQTGFTESCSGHGTWRNNKCECERLWIGDRCQHKVDCEDATDCNDHGECVDIATDPNPIKHCYCQLGWHGIQCDKASSVASKTIDYSLYRETRLSDDYNLYYRYIAFSEEIEMVLKVNSSNWVAIGWRPSSFRSGCQLFPNLPNTRTWSAGSDEVTSDTTSKPEPEGEGEGTGEPEGEGEATAKPEGEAEGTTAEPEGEGEATTKPEGEAEGTTAEPEGEGEATPKPEGEAEGTTAEPEGEGEATPKPEGEAEGTTAEPEGEGEATPKPEGEPQPCGSSWSTGCTAAGCQYKASWNYKSNTDDITFVLESTSTASWLAIGFSDDQNMPNSDAIYGFIDGTTVTVKDAYLATRSRPTVDGTQNVVDVNGAVANGVLKIEMKRARNTGDSADKSFTDTDCYYFLYAMGTVTNNQLSYHSSSRWISSEKICIKACAAPEPETTSEPETEGEPTSEPETEGEPTSEPETDGEPTSEPETEGETTSEPETEGETTSEPETEGESTTEPETEGEEGEGESGNTNNNCITPEAGYSNGGSFFGNNDRQGRNLGNGMDCSDIIVGTARGDLSRISDYYTRDRSTPKYDSIYGGEDSLTGALGFEQDGQTVIVFRRKVEATHRSDHTIEKNSMSVIWAHGQIEGNYRHRQTTGDKPGFYAKDQLLYHGAAPNRGTASINFLENANDLSTTCNGNWPSECNDCDLQVFWVYNEATDDISFTMKARLNGQQKWIGIGFSEDNVMPNSDAIIGWIDGDVVTVTDRWMDGRVQPQKDTTDNIKNIGGSLNDGVTTISFDRARDTGDSSDLAFSDTQCLYMFYAMGGEYDSSNGRISQHVNTPVISRSKICIRSCDVVASGVKLVTTVEVTLESQFDPKLRDRESVEFKKLEGSMQDWMKMVFRSLTGFQKTEILEFKEGSIIVVADVESVRESDSDPSKALYKSDVESLLNTGKSSPPQGYTISAFTVSEPRSDRPPEPFRLTLIEEIVIGLAVSLVIVIIIVAVCKLSETKREKAHISSKHQRFNGDSSSGSGSGSSTTSLSNQKQNMGNQMPVQSYTNVAYNATPNPNNGQPTTITYDEFMKNKP